MIEKRKRNRIYEIKQESMIIGEYISNFEDLKKYFTFFYHQDEKIQYI